MMDVRDTRGSDLDTADDREQLNAQQQRHYAYNKWFTRYISWKMLRPKAYTCISAIFSAESMAIMCVLTIAAVSATGTHPAETSPGALYIMMGALAATTLISFTCSLAFREGASHKGFVKLTVQSAIGLVIGMQCLLAADSAISVSNNNRLSLGLVLLIFVASVGTNVAQLNMDGSMPVVAAFYGVKMGKLSAGSAAALLQLMAVARLVTIVVLAAMVPRLTGNVRGVVIVCGAACLVTQNLVSVVVIGAHLLSVHTYCPVARLGIVLHITLVSIVAVVTAATDAAALAYITGMAVHKAFVWCACLSTAIRFVGALVRSLHSAHLQQQDIAGQAAHEAREALRSSLVCEARDRLALFRYVNHEYRGPLNAMVLGLELLRERLTQADDVESVALVSDMDHEANVLDRLLVALDEFSTIEQSRFMPEPAALDIHSAVRVIIDDMVSSSIGVHGDVTIACSRGSPLAYGLWLERVLRVYFQNAVRFSRHCHTPEIHVRIWDAWDTDHGPMTFTTEGVPLQGTGMIVGSAEEDPASLPTIQLGRAIDAPAVPGQVTKLLGISVVDNGKGVDARDMHSLFRPFEQLRLGGSSSTDATSTGLGLAIVRALTLRLGGCVGALSECGVRTGFYAMVPVPDEGRWLPPSAGVPVVCWSLRGHGRAPREKAAQGTLPSSTQSVEDWNVVPCPPAHASNGRQVIERPEDAAGDPVPSSTLRLLVVDDSTSCRKMLTRLLRVKAPEYAVDEASDGQIAVDMVTSQPPGYYSLIFMDNDMPRMKGVEAVAFLRARGVRTRITMVTGTTTVVDREAFIDAGVDAVLSKPVRAAQLLQQLQLLPSKSVSSDN